MQSVSLQQSFERCGRVKFLFSYHATMDFVLQLSGATATGNISPEVIHQFTTMFGGMIIVWSVIRCAVMVFMIIARWKVFEKAGFPGRGTLIPFYNIYLVFKLGWMSGWNLLWIFFMPVFVILMIINFFKIAVRFQKPAIYGLGIWLVRIVFIPILAFDKSVYTPLIKTK